MRRALLLALVGTVSCADSPTAHSGDALDWRFTEQMEGEGVRCVSGGVLVLRLEERVTGSMTQVGVCSAGGIVENIGSQPVNGTFAGGVLRMTVATCTYDGSLNAAGDYMWGRVACLASSPEGNVELVGTWQATRN